MMTGKQEDYLYPPCGLETYFSQYLMKTPTRNRSRRKSSPSNQSTSSKPEKVTPKVQLKARVASNHVTTITAKVRRRKGNFTDKPSHWRDTQNRSE